MGGGGHLILCLRTATPLPTYPYLCACYPPGVTLDRPAHLPLLLELWMGLLGLAGTEGVIQKHTRIISYE